MRPASAEESRKSRLSWAVIVAMLLGGSLAVAVVIALLVWLLGAS